MSSESLFHECPSCNKMVSKNIKKCPNCGTKIKKITALQWVGICLLSLFLIGVFNSPSKEDSQVNDTVTINKSNKEIVAENLEFNYKWRKSGFGSIMEIDFTVKNNSDYDIKDIEIYCEHQAGSQTKIDSNSKIIYEIFKAKTNRKFSEFNMGFIHSQAKNTSCSIKNFVVI